MIVVTADHGYAFEVGVKDRRLVTEPERGRDRPVPMFVKAPGQTRRHRRELRAGLDIVPTMADLLVPRSRGATTAARRSRRHPAARRGGAPHPRLQQGDQDRPTSSSPAAPGKSARRRARLVGTGAESQVLFGSPWAALYRVGRTRI